MCNYQELNLNINIMRPEINLFLSNSYVNIHNDKYMLNILLINSDSLINYNNNCFFFNKNKCYLGNNNYKIKIIIKDSPNFIIDLFNIKDFVFIKNKEFFTNLMKKAEKQINVIADFIEKKNNELNFLFMKVITIYGNITSSILGKLYKILEFFDLDRLRNIKTLEELEKEAEPYKLVNPSDALFIIRDELAKNTKNIIIMDKDKHSNKINITFSYFPYGTISIDYYYFFYFLKDGKDIITKYLRNKVIDY